jgi:hypothetical protein
MLFSPRPKTIATIPPPIEAGRSTIMIVRTVLVFLLLVAPGEAQTRWWSRGYVHRGNVDVELLPGGSVLAGYAFGASPGNQDAVLLRLDDVGAVVWARVLGGAGADILWKVRATSDGGFLAVGTTESFGGGDAWMVKVNADGSIAWQHAFNGYSPRDMLVTPDGGVIVVGSTGPSGNLDGWVGRFDSTGAVQWLRTYGGAADDWLQVVAATADGGYLVAGTTFSFGATSQDAWALKLDGAGGVEWQRRYDGSTDESVFGAAATVDGGFLLAGNVSISPSNRGFLMRLSAAGDLLWQKTGISSFVFGRSFTGVAGLADGSIVVTEAMAVSYTIQEYRLWKLDAAGQPLWSASVPASSALRVADDGYLVAGTQYSVGGYTFAELAKVGPSGESCLGLTPVVFDDRVAATTPTTAVPVSASAAVRDVAGSVSLGDTRSFLECSDGPLPLVSTPGLYDPATSVFYLRGFNATGTADLTFAFGPPGSGWTPLVGDWDGDGTDTVGLYDPSRGLFFLRNSNTSGVADIAFQYGPAGRGWIPVVGDWDGNGTDTVGLYDPATSTWYLRNSNDSGFADLTFTYGPGGAGWRPLAGQWFGAAASLVGLYDPAASVFYLAAHNGDPYASSVFAYGPPAEGWTPLTGDWNGDGDTSIALFDPTRALWFLRNTNDSGFADVTFAYGPGSAGFIPLAGDWNGR